MNKTEKKIIQDIKDYVNFLNRPDNLVYQEHKSIINICFAKAIGIVEENAKQRLLKKPKEIILRRDFKFAPGYEGNVDEIYYGDWVDEDDNYFNTKHYRMTEIISQDHTGIYAAKFVRIDNNI